MKAADHQGVAFVRLQSPCVMDTARDARAQLAPALAGEGHVVLDLRSTVLDTTGLGVIFSLQRRLELNGRRLLVVATDRKFLRLLELVGATDVLPVFPNADAAVAFAQSLPPIAQAA